MLTKDKNVEKKLNRIIKLCRNIQKTDSEVFPELSILISETERMLVKIKPKHYSRIDSSSVPACIKGTWITTKHIVSLFVNGWTWDNILRAHPEINTDDIRACVEYEIRGENSETVH